MNDKTQKRSVTHATFVVERTFDATPQKVWAAFATKEGKKKWFSGPPEWGPDKGDMDFREGGLETSTGGPPGGFVSHFESRYLDIVPESRIVYSYNMFVDGVKLSSSLSTIELVADGKRTRVTLTEHGAYFDGHEDPKLREEGTRQAFEQLRKAVEG